MPSPAHRLNQLLTESNSSPLGAETSAKFEAYLAVLQKWNARTNLTAIRDEEGILSLHFLESILCAQHLPINIISLLDYGSGAGFPGIPISIIRKDLSVVLAESQNKKAAFLREAVRILELDIEVHAGRAEDLKTKFDCVTLRAVDHMEQSIESAAKLLNPNGWLAILTTTTELPTIKATNLKEATLFIWQPAVPMATGTDRVLLLGHREDAWHKQP